MKADARKIDPTLPHYEVRRFLAGQAAGVAFDITFALLVGLPKGPAYSTDLNVLVSALNDSGHWWHLSHLKAAVILTSPAPGLDGLVTNSAAYDREGTPIEYTASFSSDAPARTLCEAWVKAVYDLPTAYFTEASAKEEAWSRVPWSRKDMMAYYRAREDMRQAAIARSAGKDTGEPERDSEGGNDG